MSRKDKEEKKEMGQDATVNAAEARSEEQQESRQEEAAAKEPSDVAADHEAKIAEANDKYLRLAAEFDNYRRRTSKERLDLISTAGADVIKGLFPIVDDFERALAALEGQEAREGVELIYNKFVAYLKSKGVNEIEALGKELDTDFHEAVAQFPVEDKEKKNRIIDVVQKGYTMNGTVVRFAKVVVGI